MRSRRNIFITAIFIFFFAGYSFAADSARMVSRANELYRKGEYKAAIELYRQALAARPDSALINFNLGAAYYQKGDYALAGGFFEKATLSRDKELESRANYNLGNTKYKSAKLKEDTDLSGAINLLRQSLGYYKRALELKGKDEDARANYELAEKELKDLMEKLKQEQGKQKQCPLKDNKGSQGSEDKEGSAKEAQSQDSDSRPKEASPAKEEEKPLGPEDAGDSGQEKDKQSGQDGEPPEGQGPKEMSQEEARMLLEGYRQEEASGVKMDDRLRGYSAQTDKDW